LDWSTSSEHPDSPTITHPKLSSSLRSVVIVVVVIVVVIIVVVIVLILGS
jgi:hypothetical protein